MRKTRCRPRPWQEPSSLPCRSAWASHRWLCCLTELLVAVQRPAGAPAAVCGKPARITTDLDTTVAPRDWPDFLALSGGRRDEFQADGASRCTHYLPALALAKAGLRVALVPDFLAKAELRTGTLAFADRTLLPSGRSYRLCFKMTRAADADLRRMVRWIKAQAKGAAIPLRQRARG